MIANRSRCRRGGNSIFKTLPAYILQGVMKEHRAPDAQLANPGIDEAWAAICERGGAGPERNFAAGNKYHLNVLTQRPSRWLLKLHYVQ